jgi:hypothetical protein
LLNVWNVEYNIWDKIASTVYKKGAIEKGYDRYIAWESSGILSKSKFENNFTGTLFKWFFLIILFFQDYANFLLKSVDLWSPDEYLNYYKKPINVILDSGIN